MNESLKNSQFLHDRMTCAGSEDVSFILVRPKEFRAGIQYPLFVFLHGRGGDPKQVLKRDYELWSQQDFFVLIPQGIYSCEFGFAWYNRKDPVQFKIDLEKDEKRVTELVKKIKSDYPVKASRIHLGGFSQGGRLAFYIGFRNPILFRGIMPVGGVFMEEQLNSRIPDAQYLHVDIFHGTEDRINSFESIKAAFYELKQKGVPVTLTSYPLDHEYTPEILARILSRVGS